MRTCKRIGTRTLTLTLLLVVASGAAAENGALDETLLLQLPTISKDHVVFVYRQNGRWGTVARSRDPGLHGRKPVFRSLRHVAQSYF